MLRQAAEGVWIHRSEFVQSNAVVVQGPVGVLLVDPGVHGQEMPSRAHAAEIADDLPLDLLGLVTGLPDGATHLPWYGPEARLIEHRAHAPGHAAVSLAERNVLIAGDLLSDVLIPMLDLNDQADQIAARLEQDRAYALAVREVRRPHDPRLTTSAADHAWVSDVHARQVEGLAQRRSAARGKQGSVSGGPGS